MSGFDDREKGFEAKFSHDEETNFRVRSRRDKLLGRWAAQQFGLPDVEAEAYANELVVSDVGQPRDDHLPEKIAADAKAHGKELDTRAVRREMRRLAEVARDDIAQGRPEAQGDE